EDLLKQGFARARVDAKVVQLSDDLKLDRQMRHHIEVVVDRLVIGANIRTRLAEAVELALRLGNGELIVAIEGKESKPAPPENEDEENTEQTSDKRSKRKAPKAKAARGRPESDLVLSAHYACTHCGLSFEPPSPQLFSFNSPQGMCKQCDGLGEIYS